MIVHELLLRTGRAGRRLVASSVVGLLTLHLPLGDDTDDGVVTVQVTISPRASPREIVANLPETGADPLLSIWLAAALTAVGVALVVLSRRTVAHRRREAFSDDEGEGRNFHAR